LIYSKQPLNFDFSNGHGVVFDCIISVLQTPKNNDSETPQHSQPSHRKTKWSLYRDRIGLLTIGNEHNNENMAGYLVDTLLLSLNYLVS
jgi:hypothetical protein